MITPQELQEKSFVKAVFGGYDMEAVDEFLEPLTEDYITLYKENSVLKGKMKVLVETIEEYRRSEDTIKKALFTAQRTADELLAETERKCTKMVDEAESAARSKVDDARAQLASEQERLARAKRDTLSYLDKIKALSLQQIEHMDALSALDIHTAATIPAPPDPDATRVFPAAAEVVAPPPQPEKADEAPIMDFGDTRVLDMSALHTHGEDINAELADEEEDDDKPRFEFIDLQSQFGKDYDPTQK